MPPSRHCVLRPSCATADRHAGRVAVDLGLSHRPSGKPSTIFRCPGSTPAAVETAKITSRPIGHSTTIPNRRRFSAPPPDLGGSNRLGWLTAWFFQNRVVSHYPAWRYSRHAVLRLAITLASSVCLLHDRIRLADTNANSSRMLCSLRRCNKHPNALTKLVNPPLLWCHSHCLYNPNDDSTISVLNANRCPARN